MKELRFSGRLKIQAGERKGGTDMLPVSDVLKRKLQETNRELRKAYPSEAFEYTAIRRRLQNVGDFVSVSRLEDTEFVRWLGDRSLVGVDGSVNSTPGSHPRTLSVFQALAKGTKGEEYWAGDVYTPLLTNGEDEADAAREARHRGALLSRLEMQAAIYAVENWQPRVVMMDGSLLHFLIDDAEEWTRLARLAESADVLLVGVSEEIGTKSLAREVFPDYPAWTDREVFYGTLKPGEAFEWAGWSPAGSGLWKVILRSSRSPQPIGIDGLLSQAAHKWDLVRLVRTLTPEQGRGIPLWLDIVDAEVRVTDRLVEAMVEEYIDPDLRHRLFLPKRSERVL
jgi:hypothetical protein